MTKLGRFLPLLLVAASAACDDSTGPTGDALTSAEARALAAAVASASNGAINMETGSDASLALLPTAPAQDRLEHSADIDVTVPCPLGGTAAINGSFDLVADDDDPEAPFITLDAQATQAHADCGFTTDDDLEITLDGDVDLLVQFDIKGGTDPDDGAIDLLYELNGNVAFVTSDGREGTCPIDFNQIFHAQAGSATHTIEGKVCGQTIQVNSSWTGRSS